MLQHHLAPRARPGGCCAGSWTQEQRDGGSCCRERGRETSKAGEQEVENWDAPLTDGEQGKEVSGPVTRESFISPSGADIGLGFLLLFLRG